MHHPLQAHSIRERCTRLRLLLRAYVRSNHDQRLPEQTARIMEVNTLSETKDIVVVALVALVALAGLVLSNGQSQGAVVYGNSEGALGASLAQQAYEAAKKQPTEQPGVCGIRCADLCPSSAWNPTMYSRTPRSDCVNMCRSRCELLLAGDYERNYATN